MNPFIKAITATTIGLGVAFSLPAVANATTTTSAATSAQPRTYSMHIVINDTGVGPKRGWYDRETEDWASAYSPVPEIAISWWGGYFKNSKLVRYSDKQRVIGGNVWFTQNNWAKIQRLNWGASYTREFINQNGPGDARSQFDRLHGIRRVSASHYRVTGDYAKLGWFLNWQWNMTAAEVSGTVTINVWDNASGLPVKMTATGSSSRFHLYLLTAYGNFDKPVHVTPPA